MWTGTQFSGYLNAGATGRWFTYNWPAAWHVVWYMMPTSPKLGAPQLEWSVAVERANTTSCTYWITIKNLSTSPINFEARYAVMS